MMQEELVSPPKSYRLLKYAIAGVYPAFMGYACFATVVGRLGIDLLDNYIFKLHPSERLKETIAVTLAIFDLLANIQSVNLHEDILKALGLKEDFQPLFYDKRRINPLLKLIGRAAMATSFAIGATAPTVGVFYLGEQLLKSLGQEALKNNFYFQAAQWAVAGVQWIPYFAFYLGLQWHNGHNGMQELSSLKTSVYANLWRVSKSKFIDATVKTMFTLLVRAAAFGYIGRESFNQLFTHLFSAPPDDFMLMLVTLVSFGAEFINASLAFAPACFNTYYAPYRTHLDEIALYNVRNVWNQVPIKKTHLIMPTLVAIARGGLASYFTYLLLLTFLPSHILSWQLTPLQRLGITRTLPILLGSTLAIPTFIIGYNHAARLADRAKLDSISPNPDLPTSPTYSRFTTLISYILNTGSQSDRVLKGIAFSGMLLANFLIPELEQQKLEFDETLFSTLFFILALMICIEVQLNRWDFIEPKIKENTQNRFRLLAAPFQNCSKKEEERFYSGNDVEVAENTENTPPSSSKSEPNYQAMKNALH